MVTDEYIIPDSKSLKVRPRAKTTRRPRVYAEEGLWVKGWDTRTDNPAWLELRFVEPGPDGAKQPARVIICRAYGEWKDGRVAQVVYGNVKSEFDLSDYPDYAKDVGATISYATAIRFPITKEWPLPLAEFRGCAMGRVYMFNFLRAGYRTVQRDDEKKKFYGRAMIRIPDDVKPGEVAVMEVDVTKYFPMWWTRVEHKTVEVQVHLSQSLASQASSISLRCRGRQESVADIIDGKRRVSLAIRPESLGGELVLQAPEMDDAGHALCYMRAVTKTTVCLPDDADLVVDKRDLVSVQLALEKANIQNVKEQLRAQPRRMGSWTSAVGLLVDRADIELVSGHEIAGNDLPREVDVAFIPGTYYVVYRDGKANRQQVIGKVTITKADAGKTLQVQPLDD